MSSDTKPIRILSADDHPLFRYGIATLVGAEPDMDLVAQASTGQEAIEQSGYITDVTLMQVFGLAFVSHNGIVSFLEPPTDHERAEKVIIPMVDPAQPNS